MAALATAVLPTSGSPYKTTTGAPSFGSTRVGKCLSKKMGAPMAENHSKLLGLYDKLGMFLSQINELCGRGVSDPLTSLTLTIVFC